MKKVLFITIMIIILIQKNTYAENYTEANDILEEQKSEFKIKDFITETKKYTSDYMEDIDTEDILNSAIKGKIDNKKLLKNILKPLGKSFKETIQTLIEILIIVLIHSVLKSITDGLEDNSVSKAVYYVQYILIITIIMKDFTVVLQNINQTIENLVGFTQTLMPILVALMIYTGSIVTTGALEPVLLFLIELVSSVINKLILPVVSLLTIMTIISKLTDKVQINKLASFMKSSINWFLVIILTAFIGVLSLEGTLTSSVDGITAKTAKAAISNVIPVVRKGPWRWCRCFTWHRSCIKKCNRYSGCYYNNWYLYRSNYKA